MDAEDIILWPIAISLALLSVSLAGFLFVAAYSIINSGGQTICN